MNHQQSLSKRFNPFLRKIVKQRTLIMMSGRSMKNDGHMRLYTDKLRRYVGTNFTDEDAAKFILHFQNEIRAIIIERNQNQITQFENMVTAASMFNQKAMAL